MPTRIETLPLPERLSRVENQPENVACPHLARRAAADRHAERLVEIVGATGDVEVVLPHTRAPVDGSASSAGPPLP